MERLSRHALAYGLILALVTAVVPLGASFGSDDGAYGGQVWALRHGGWTLDRPVPVVAEANEGWLNTSITADGPTPYTTNPAYAALLVGTVRLVHGPPPAADEGLGDAEHGADVSLGLHLPGLVGALASACLAWAVAIRWDRRSGPVAFWLLALGPILVDTTALWAHPLSTAAAGTAVLAALHLLPTPASGPARRGPADSGRARGRFCAALSRPGRDIAAQIGCASRNSVVEPGRARSQGQSERLRRAAGRWGWRATLVLALVAGAAVRSEAVFFTAGLLAAVLVVERSWAMVATAAMAGIAVLAATGANRAWQMQLRAGRVPVETSVEVLEGHAGWAVSRVPAAWQLLATSLRPSLGAGLVLVALIVVIVAGLELGRGRDEPGTTARLGPAVLVALAASLYLVKAVVEPGQVIPGLAAAWPVVPLALVAGRAGGGRYTVAASPDAGPRDGPGRTPGPDAGPRAGPGRDPGPGWLLIPCALLLAAVLATQYAASGGLQWGGRYLSMSYVPLAAAAALQLRPLLSLPRAAGVPGDPGWFRLGASAAPGRAARVPGGPGRLLVGALTALVVAPAVTGVVVSHRLHTTHNEVVVAVTARPAEVVITEIPALPRIAWTALPTAFYRADATTIEPLLIQLAQAGVTTVNVQGSEEVHLDGMAGYQVTPNDGPVRHLILTRDPSPNPVTSAQVPAPDDRDPG